MYSTKTNYSLILPQGCKPCGAEIEQALKKLSQTGIKVFDGDPSRNGIQIGSSEEVKTGTNREFKVK